MRLKLVLCLKYNCRPRDLRNVYPLSWPPNDQGALREAGGLLRKVMDDARWRRWHIINVMLVEDLN